MGAIIRDTYARTSLVPKSLSLSRVPHFSIPRHKPVSPHTPSLNHAQTVLTMVHQAPPVDPDRLWHYGIKVSPQLPTLAEKQNEGVKKKTFN